MAESTSETFMRAFVDQYRVAHGVIREQISNLDAATLGWAPCEGANSIAVLVTHITGSETEAVRTLAGVASDRDRSSEFDVRGADAESLLALIDRAEATLVELAPKISAEQLAADHVRPASLDRTPKP